MKVYNNEELEKIALEEVKKFKSKIIDREFDNYYEMKIELFSEIHLGLNIDYKYIIENTRYALLAIDPLYLPISLSEENGVGENKVDLIVIEGKTIVINTAKEENKNEAVLRFSVAHESAHWILHRSYSNEEKEKFKEQLEWEANYLAAALLMPKDLFKNKIEETKVELNLDLRNELDFNKLKEKVAQIFNVSKVAVDIRFKNLYSNNNLLRCTQKCERVEGKKAIVRSKPVTKNSCLNQELRYEITEKYTENRSIYKSELNSSFVEIYKRIEKEALNRGIERWKLDKIYSIPKKIIQLKSNQFYVFCKEENAFYSATQLSISDRIEVREAFEKSIENFNKEENLNIDIDKLDFNISESKKVKLSTINYNEELLKICIAKDISDGKFIYMNKELEFLPCYNINSGIELISDFIEDNYGELKRRYSLVMQFNIKNYNDKKYLEPKIVLRRFVSNVLSAESLGSQYRSNINKRINLNRVIFIKQEDRYITLRIVKDKNGNKEKPFKVYYKDYFVYEGVKENLDISIMDINNVLLGNKQNRNILIAYHSSMETIDTKIGAGVHSNDKLLIKDYILKKINSLKIVEAEKAINVKNKLISEINKVAIDEGKLEVDKVVIKNTYDYVDLYVFNRLLNK